MGYVLTVILLGANMPTSVYGLYRTEFGFTPTIQTLIYGVYVAGLVPALLFFGPLSDALGRRTVLLTALALSVVGTLVLAFATRRCGCSSAGLLRESRWARPVRRAAPRWWSRNRSSIIDGQRSYRR